MLKFSDNIDYRNFALVSKGNSLSISWSKDLSTFVEHLSAHPEYIWKKNSNGPYLSSISSDIIDASLLDISQAGTGKYDISVACINSNGIYAFGK